MSPSETVMYNVLLNTSMTTLCKAEAKFFKVALPRSACDPRCEGHCANEGAKGRPAQECNSHECVIPMGSSSLQIGTCTAWITS